MGADEGAIGRAIPIVSEEAVATALALGSGTLTLYDLSMTGMKNMTAWPGAPLALVSAALFGASTPFAKLLLGQGTNPWLLAGLLYLGSGLGLGTWFVFRENVDRRILIGAGAILSGAALLSWTSGPMPIGWGAVLIAGACLAWGIDNNLTRKLSGADPVQIAAAKGIVAGAVNLALALASGAFLPHLPEIAGATIIGFLGYGVSLVLFVLALRHLGSARTGAYFSMAPFIGTVLAVAMLGEPVTIRLVAAALLMGIGLWLHLAERHEHEHVHEELEHEHRHVHDEHHQHVHSLDDPIGEPHTHRHQHAPLAHSHVHYPDLHHRHRHN